MPSQLRNRIKVSRIFAGLTQEQLGDACGVTKSGVSCWETGNAKKLVTPTLHNLKSISEATGAPIGWLVDDESEIEPSWSRYETVASMI